MPQGESKAGEWTPADSVETRKFRCEIVEEGAGGEGGEGGPRLQLVANAERQVRLLIRVSAEQIGAVRKELFDRGYRGGLSCCGSRVSYGSWRNYLNELDLAHIVVEMLEWTLTPEEEATLDAVDDYGRRAPTGFTSSRLK